MTNFLVESQALWQKTDLKGTLAGKTKKNFLIILTELHYTSKGQVHIVHSVPSQVEVPSGSDLWSDHPRPNYPLIRLKLTQNNVCARSALETFSDRTFPDAKDLWSDQNQTIVQTIVRPWPGPNSDHRPGDGALQITPDQNNVRSKAPLIRLNCARYRPISEWVFIMNEYCYNIFILKKLMFTLLKSSNKRTTLKVLLLKKRQPNCS